MEGGGLCGARLTAKKTARNGKIHLGSASISWARGRLSIRRFSPGGCLFSIYYVPGLCSVLDAPGGVKTLNTRASVRDSAVPTPAERARSLTCKLTSARCPAQNLLDPTAFGSGLTYSGHIPASPSTRWPPPSPPASVVLFSPGTAFPSLRPSTTHSFSGLSPSVKTLALAALGRRRLPRIDAYTAPQTDDPAAPPARMHPPSPRPQSSWPEPMAAGVTKACWASEHFSGGRGGGITLLDHGWKMAEGRCGGTEGPRNRKKFHSCSTKPRVGA